MVEFAWLFVIAHVVMATIVLVPIVFGRMSRSAASGTRALGRSLGFWYFTLRFGLFLGPSIVSVFAYVAQAMDGSVWSARECGIAVTAVVSMWVAFDIVRRAPASRPRRP